MNRQKMKDTMGAVGAEFMAQQRMMTQYGYPAEQSQREATEHPAGPFGSTRVDIPDDVGPPPPPVGAGKGFTGI